jgi:hypothetical protein
VKYHSASSFRAAIDARLKRYAAEHGQAALARQRKRIVFDRFLARLIQAAPGEWTLKGGVALDYRLGEKARATRDLDLLHNPDVDALGNELADAESMDLGDFFQFSIQRTDKLDSLTDGSAIRYHVLADLDSRQFERFIVDVGFDQPGPFRPESMHREGFLVFAGVASPPFPTLPIEVHLAEKVHAYARIYSGGNSSRVKDLIDMVLIGTTQSLSANSCRLALEHIHIARRACGSISPRSSTDRMDDSLPGTGRVSSTRFRHCERPCLCGQDARSAAFRGRR